MLPSLEAIALELLEYKIHEFRDTRTVRGGMESVWNLVALLSRDHDRLDPEQRERYEVLTSELATLGQEKQRSATVPSLDALTLEEDGAVELATEVETPVAVKPADTPQEREEQAVLQRLAHHVWWDDLEEFVARTAAAWRAEQGRTTARLVYGLVQNLNRNAVKSTLGGGGGERPTFRVVEPIPGLRDPLVSLSDLNALAEIVRDVIGVIMTFGKAGNPLPYHDLPESRAYHYVRQAAMTLVRDPYAGSYTPGGKDALTSQQLKLAIQELVRDRLAEEEKAKQRRILERRLIEVSARERSERLTFNREVEVFKVHMEAFLDRLADYLPTKVGGRASGPRLEGGVLFGVNPLLRWDRVQPGATAVTIRMMGPVRLTLAGHDLAITGVGSERTLHVDGVAERLEGTKVMVRARARISAFREGDYVHIRVRNLAKSLAARVADALVSAYVLMSREREEVLAVLKVLTNNVKGEAQEIAAEAIVRAAAVSARAPDRARTIEGLIRGAARAARVTLQDDTVRTLTERMLAAMDESAPSLSAVIEGAGVTEYDLQPFTTEPMTFQAGAYRLTVRQYREASPGVEDTLVAMLPGQVLGSFTDQMVVARPDGVLLFAAGDDEVVVILLER